jgi:TRAP-type C4-dicarboxylate transport system permease large subunit
VNFKSDFASIDQTYRARMRVLFYSSQVNRSRYSPWRLFCCRYSNFCVFSSTVFRRLLQHVRSRTLNADSCKTTNKSFIQLTSSFLSLLYSAFLLLSNKHGYCALTQSHSICVCWCILVTVLTHHTVSNHFDTVFH